MGTLLAEFRDMPRDTLYMIELLVTAVCLIACTTQVIGKPDPPKSWHHAPQQRELWGLEEISFSQYERIKVGDSVAILKKDPRHKKIVCYVCWLNRKSYQTCFKIENGIIT